MSSRNQFSGAEPFEDRYIPEPNTGCWLWLRSRNIKSGYGQVLYEGKCVNAHRWSWILHNGPIPDGLCVLHKCDTRTCVNPYHLFLGTRADNNQDRDQKGRSRGGSLKGEQNPSAKMTGPMVDDLRKKRKDGWGYEELGKYFGIHRDVTYMIATGRAWRHRPTPQ